MTKSLLPRISNIYAKSITWINVISANIFTGEKSPGARAGVPLSPGAQDAGLLNAQLNLGQRQGQGALIRDIY